MNRLKLMSGLNFNKITVFLMFTFFIVICNQGCTGESVEIIDEDNVENIDPVGEDTLINSTFRIDIVEMEVTLIYKPDENIVIGDSLIEFKMREGQTKPLVHFDLPADSKINTIILNGESLDPENSADVEFISFDETTQKGLEFKRNCIEGSINTLRVNYTLSYVFSYKYFASDVNDISGIGNETIFPTINSPIDLSRHKITFAVESNRKYSFIGSGKVTDISDAKTQKWLLDTERDVASYTVMFMLIPQDDIILKEREINGVDVRVMAYKDGVSVDDAFDILEEWLPELASNIGSFPMQRGLSVFLTVRGGGMEYFGATITSLYALEHEVFHMYFGCSVVAKTYRDSWWDEAINMWYELNAKGSLKPINEDFKSDIVSGRTPVSVGFNDRAYDEGAMIIEYCSEEIGGRENFISFLSYLYEKYTFSPFNTFSLVEYFKDFSGIDMKSKFLNWLYKGVQTYFSGTSDFKRKYHEIDMTPPPSIIEKYKKK